MGWRGYRFTRGAFSSGRLLLRWRRPQGRNEKEGNQVPKCVHIARISSRNVCLSARCAPNKPQSPQPPSHIFMVPLGPKLVRSTSCSPRAAHILTAKAAWARATSALEFIAFIADITRKRKEPCNRQKQPEPRFQGQPRRHGRAPKPQPIPDRTGSDVNKHRRDGSQNRLGSGRKDGVLRLGSAFGREASGESR